MVVAALNILAVCDPGTDFCRRLAEYAETKAGYPFALQPFSSLEQLREYQKKRQPEAVLLAEELYREKDWQEYDHPLFLLGSGFGKEEGPGRVFRYQEAEGILRDILLLYRTQVPKLTAKVAKGRFCLYAVADAGESCRSEALAFELAAQLAQSEKVLWLDLRTWPVIQEMTGCQKGGDLGELLYDLCRRREELTDMLPARVCSFCGVDMLPAAVMPADFREVTGEDWRYLFEQLKRESCYTAVVSVTGNMIQPLDAFLELFDVIWITGEESQMLCQERMEKYIKNNACPQIWQRIFRVQLPCQAMDPAADRQILGQLAAKALQESGAEK